MNPLDQFIRRELRCPAYLRYVDDMALFSDSKRELWDWKAAIMGRLQRLRLTIHDKPAQVEPVTAGIPWLGFVIYPERRRLKSRKTVQATRRLGERFAAWQAGKISFAEFDASVQGWINHVRFADTWGLREHVLGQLVWSPGEGKPASGRAGQKISRDRAERGRKNSDQRFSGQRWGTSTPPETRCC